jgi:hypothetical protein
MILVFLATWFLRSFLLVCEGKGETSTIGPSNRGAVGWRERREAESWGLASAGGPAESSLRVRATLYRLFLVQKQKESPWKMSTAKTASVAMDVYRIQ